MDKKGTYMLAGLLMVAIAGFIVVSFQKTTLDTRRNEEVPVATTSDWENAPAETQASPEQNTTVTAKHAYREGAHIVAGEVPLPTGCDILESNVVASGDKKQILIQLVSSVKSGEKCPPQITPARFKVSAKANKEAILTATYNGQPVTLNLIEASPGENLDDFELYIKG